MTHMHNLNLDGFIIRVHKYHHISYASMQLILTHMSSPKTNSPHVTNPKEHLN